MQAVFGEEDGVVYEQPGKDSKTISAIYDRESFRADVGNEMEISTTQPVIDIILSELGFDPKRNDRVQVQGVWHKVTEWRPDGHGSAELDLQKDE